MITHGGTAVAVMLAGLLAAGPAPGQTTRPESVPAAAAADGAAAEPSGALLLAGPAVEESARRAPAPVRGRAVPPRRWLAVFRDLDLTAAQRARLRAVVAELGRTRRAFRREHGAELDELRRRGAEIRRTDRRPPPALRERLAALEALAPKPAVHQQRLWQSLTPAQQEQMRRALASERGPARGREPASMAPARPDDPAALDPATRRRLRFLRRHRSREGDG